MPVSPSPRWELPTLAVAAAIYGGFAVVTWEWQALPLWLAAPLLALLLAWQGSLQHETIHHHPTPHRRLNALLGALALALWLPYERYRQTHLAHHAHGGATLTDPEHDPESHYLPAGSFARSGTLWRLLRWWNMTLSGRLLIGPALLLLGFWPAELSRLAAEAEARRIWLRHGLAVALVLGWTSGVCGIPPATYVLLGVYPAISLGLLRSFSEHRAHRVPAHRTAVVESGAFWSALFLNNNLHAVHHRHPDLPWYRLPAAWRAAEHEIELGPEMHFRGGYAEIFARHIFRPAVAAEHPGF